MHLDIFIFLHFMKGKAFAPTDSLHSTTFCHNNYTGGGGGGYSFYFMQSNVVHFPVFIIIRKILTFLENYLFQ